MEVTSKYLDEDVPTKVGSFLLTRKKSWVTEEQAFQLIHGNLSASVWIPPPVCDGSLLHNYPFSSQLTHDKLQEGKRKQTSSKKVLQFNDDDNNVAMEKNYCEFISYKLPELSTNGMSPLMMMTQGFYITPKFADGQYGITRRPHGTSNPGTFGGGNSTNTTQVSKRFQCDVCQKKFRSKSKLRAHAITHSNLRPWACEICFKPFKRKCHLEKHGLVHSNRKDFFCSVCTKGFKTKCDLKEHSDVHSEVRDFKCDLCGTDFKRKSGLNLHKRKFKHEFSCKLCEKRFISRRELMEHIAIHSDMEL